MLDSFWFAVLMGCVLGFLSGLGVGGGSLLLLWLTLVMDVPQSQARVMNLMFFLPCALIASVFRWKQSRPDPKIAGTAIAAGIAGAVLGTWLGGKLDMELLKKGFGVLFILCGIRELRYRPR